jgi:hypothetical protein
MISSSEEWQHREMIHIEADPGSFPPSTIGTSQPKTVATYSRQEVEALVK